MYDGELINHIYFSSNLSLKNYSIFSKKLISLRHHDATLLLHKKPSRVIVYLFSAILPKNMSLTTSHMTSISYTVTSEESESHHQNETAYIGSKKQFTKPVICRFVLFSSLNGFTEQIKGKGKEEFNAWSHFLLCLLTNFR